MIKAKRIWNEKKGQFYPMLMAIFLILVLTVAFVKISGTKQICYGFGNHCDSKNDIAIFGQKQTQIFYTLQDAESIKLYLDQSAKIAAQQSLDDIEYSCKYEENFGDASEDDFACGNYVVPSWSTNEKLCLPDCEYAFKGKFNENLGKKLSDFYLTSKIQIPNDFNLRIEEKQDGFTILGESNQKITLNSFTPDVRKSIEAKPEKITSDKEIIDTIKQEEEEKKLNEPTQPTIPTSPTTLAVLTIPTTPQSSTSQKITLTWPTKQSKQINSCFGERNVPGASRNHKGLDIQSGASEVLSPAPGKVVLAGTTSKTNEQLFDKNGKLLDVPSCWGLVVIEHTPQFKTLFLHLQDINVKPGDFVKTGTVLGIAGGRGRKGATCADNAYATHIHMEVISSKSPVVDKELNSVLLAKYDEPDYYSSNFVSGYAINPSCFLDSSGATIANAPNCYSEINKNLDEVCPVYGFNDVSYTYASFTPTKTNTNSMTGDAIYPTNSITGAVEGNDRPIMDPFEKEDIPYDSSAPSAKYSFAPSFAVDVNQKLNDPLKNVFEWSKNTWETCTNDLSSCIETEMNEFNADENNNYKIGFGSTCDLPKQDLYNAFIESFEDCASNKYAGCSCTFDAKDFSSDKDLVITLEKNYVVLSEITIDEDSKKEIETEIEKTRQELSFGYNNKDAFEIKKIRFSFSKEDLSLEKVVATGYNVNSEGVLEESQVLSENESVVKFVKLAGEENNNDAMQLISADNKEHPSCAWIKDKYRFCATPKDTEDKTLSQLKFSMQFKTEVSAGVCYDSYVEVIPQTKKMDSFVKEIASIKGIDSSLIFSAIPIPGLSFLSTTISVGDLLQNLPETQSASLKVVVKNYDPTIVGYNVYCNDFPVDINVGYLKSNNPNSFALFEEKAKEINGQIQKSNIAKVANPYIDIIEKRTCKAPVPTENGVIKQVNAVKVSSEGDFSTFSIKACGASNVLMQKLNQQQYCLTLVPVDAQGKPMPDCAIKTCADTNSLFDLALDKLLKSQLEQFALVPPSLIPDNLKPFITIPDSQDLTDATLGRRGFDFADVVDTAGAKSYYESQFRSMIVKEIGTDLTATSFTKALDEIGDAKKQAVLISLSEQIKDNDAKMLFDNLVEGKSVSQAMKSSATSKMSEKIPDESTRKIITETITSSNPTSTALHAMSNFAIAEFDKKTEGKKKDILEKAAEKKEGAEAKQKIIQKAFEKNCVKTYSVAVSTAIDCLTNDEMNEVFKEIAEKKQDARTLIDETLKDADIEKAKEIMQQVSAARDFEGTARNMLLDEFEKIPDSEKKQLVTEMLTSPNSIDDRLKNELTQQIVSLSPDYVTDLLKNQNAKALIGSQLESHLKSQLNSLLEVECVEEE